LLHAVYGDAVFAMRELPPVAACPPSEAGILRRMLQRGLNAHRTSSAGRLFDAVAAMTGLRQEVKFEGQAAMELEFAVDGVDSEEVYEFGLLETELDGPLVIDWAPLVRGVVRDVREAAPVGLIAARFHNTLAECIVAVARRLGAERVVLTGGCFQNRYLTERTVRRLRESQFRPYWHQRVPPNDGGLALGQIVAAAKETSHVSGSSR